MQSFYFYSFSSLNWNIPSNWNWNIPFAFSHILKQIFPLYICMYVAVACFEICLVRSHGLLHSCHNLMNSISHKIYWIVNIDFLSTWNPETFISILPSKNYCSIFKFSFNFAIYWFFFRFCLPATFLAGPRSAAILAFPLTGFWSFNIITLLYHKKKKDIEYQQNYEYTSKLPHVEKLIASTYLVLKKLKTTTTI